MGYREDVVILTIAGSLRSGSVNRALLRAAVEDLPAGVRAEDYAGLAGLPAFDEDLERIEPRAVAELRASLARADALLIATPEYNGSVPGALKNALDWASRPYGSSVLTGLPTAVIGASPSGYGASQAQAALRAVLDASGAAVAAGGVAVSDAPGRIDTTGRLVDAEVRRALGAVVVDLVRTVRAEQPAA